MKWTSIVAIYFLAFVSTAFIMLPFGITVDEEAANSFVPGQAESAPTKFDLRSLLVRAAVIAAVLVALFDLNYIYGWVTTDDLDVYRWIFG